MLKKYKVTFYRESEISAWVYLTFQAADSERAIARINKELDKLKRLKDSSGNWILKELAEVQEEKSSGS